MKLRKGSTFVALGLLASITVSTNAMAANASEISLPKKYSEQLASLHTQIPTTFKPGSILTYNDKQQPIVTYDTSVEEHRNTASSLEVNKNFTEEVPDIEGRIAEDAFFKAVADSVKNLPVVDLGFDLPPPSPGTVVIYGSDGHINRIYLDKSIASIQAEAAAVPSTTVPYPGRLAPGTYTYGSGQKVVVSAGAVTGEGRFTVFRAGVGGSGTIGSSGKTLGAGDIATKRQIDNAVHGTPVTARALDTNITKTVYKNDIGSLPDAVMDNYFWGWNNKQFGYTYSDTLSFPGRYYYQF
ncbi:hypothetical protein [Saccharibacillus kuerlensis]|uniref:Uncharacterized protein n=1 Tax=Saccharibacillus kuerlensis TaxID=459527 RepID=A0ABQ2L3C0_9BACL|nr:hypothetical protein [Saccharibacillus kuerlensis]GGO01021.1 hypothetical protein GCM10010969_22850 [Saccharibacillus kuerlensis]